MKKLSWFRKERTSPMTWVLAGGAAVAALLIIARSTPDLIRYLRIERM
jgi:hypothetical protein